MSSFSSTFPGRVGRPTLAMFASSWMFTYKEELHKSQPLSVTAGGKLRHALARGSTSLNKWPTFASLCVSPRLLQQRTANQLQTGDARAGLVFTDWLSGGFGARRFVWILSHHATARSGGCHSLSSGPAESCPNCPWAVSNNIQRTIPCSQCTEWTL